MCSHKQEVISKWLRDFGLIVNEKKTELCLFHKSPQPLVELCINGELIRSKNRRRRTDHTNQTRPHSFNQSKHNKYFFNAYLFCKEIGFL